MTPERWRQITETFHAARERDPAHREAFIADACRDDPTLRREVEAMLAGLDHAGRFGESPLFASASRPEPAPTRDVIQLAPGSQLGPYQIRGLLGAGGMGHVYKAFDLGSTARSRSRSPQSASASDSTARFEQSRR